MSFSKHNKGSNRIPSDSVALSDKKYLIKVDDIIPPELLTNEEKIEKKKKTALEQKEEELNNYEVKLKEFENELKNKIEMFEREKQEFLERFRYEEEKYERKKRQEYYEIREFMWDNALVLAERIVGQKIKSEDFSLENMFINLIKELPIAFDELTVTAHPETVTLLNERNSKNSWILKNINWKYSYELQMGEFIVEDEKEYYDYRFSSIFGEMKRKVEQLHKEKRQEEND
ncbi:hypothetical protein U8V72_11180 [Priestia filamentosa]|uniref:hypothetical protein n=1 Tax=Priestia filamentosa TaxID=1402861 RepID=UPI003977FC74